MGFSRFKSRCKASIYQNSGYVFVKKRRLARHVDVFGMNVTHDDDDEHSDIFGVVDDEFDDIESVDGDGGDDVDDLFGIVGVDDDVDDMFASSVEVADEEETTEVVEKEFVPVEEYPDSSDEDDGDDDDIDIDSLFG